MTGHNSPPTADRARLCAVLVCCVAVLAMSCAPQAGVSREASGSSQAAVSAPKTLKIGTRKVPEHGIILFEADSAGAVEQRLTFHAGLTNFDGHGNVIPHLAQRVPSIDGGDWTLTPDGQMEVVWRLQPNVVWHDGTRLSAEDFMLAVRVLKDDDVPAVRGRWVSLVSNATALDDQTLVLTWREPYILANSLNVSDLPPLPRHLIGDLYQGGDKQGFANSPYWTHQFVGVGAYRMGEWVPGASTEAVASDSYFLGRPKIDRIIFRYIHDINTMIANLLAGDIDTISVGSIKGEDVVTIRQAWESSGRGTVISSMMGLRVLWFQFRDPGAPWLRDARVRRALTHGLDRQTIVDTLHHGTTTVGDTLLPPDDPAHRLAEERGLPRYGFDPGQAERLMAEAGWTKPVGASYQGAGGRFGIEIRTVGGSPENLREILAIADLWNNTGFNASTYLIPSEATNKDELRAKTEGVFSIPLKLEPEAMGEYITTQTPTEATRWRGRNRGGYSNPAYDRLYDQYITTLETPKRQGLLADLLKLAADDVIFVPVYYDISTSNVAFRKGLRGPGQVSASQIANLWNVHTWEMD